MSPTFRWLSSLCEQAAGRVAHSCSGHYYSRKAMHCWFIFSSVHSTWMRIPIIIELHFQTHWHILRIASFTALSSRCSGIRCVFLGIAKTVEHMTINAIQYIDLHRIHLEWSHFALGRSYCWLDVCAECEYVCLSPWRLCCVALRCCPITQLINIQLIVVKYNSWLSFNSFRWNSHVAGRLGPYVK